MIALREYGVAEQTSTGEECLQRHRLLHPWIRYAYHRNKICSVAFVPIIYLLLPGMPRQLRWSAVLATLVIAIIYRICGIINAAWEKNICLLAKNGNPLVLGALLDFADVAFRGSNVPAENYSEEERQILTRYLPDMICKVRAGDCPDLTRRQQSTLRWLVCHRYFRLYLCGDDLSDLIRGILDQGATKDRRECGRPAARGAKVADE